MGIDKNTVFKAAETMAERFGNDALSEVDQRIDELRALNQQDILEFWTAVRKAVVLLAGGSTNTTKH